ncbi:MAG: MFS transporter [Acidobacteria bacterium]|nr:MFS transporter [Acidobacteriota bacterium]
MRPVAEIRASEATTAFLMFAYSFLAMTSYNIIKPITRSEFISNLGADNLPWVQFGAGVLIGLIMQAYSMVMAAVPRRWTIPVTQAGMVGLLLLFWLLFTTIGAEWISVAFYLVGLILGILLISQFWTLANDVYDPRQAKRIFGFIGGGASLGGASGAALTKFLVEQLGSYTMLLLSASIMALCLGIVVAIVKRERKAGASDARKTGEEESVSSGEALQLLRSSRHLQIIALVIGFAAVGAAIIEQQLNMATAEAKGQQNADAIAAFLAEITIYLSLAGFFIQVFITSRIHRFLGIGFALMILPVSLGGSGLLMLLNGALWTAGLARVLDTSLRYTVDKTSREILFLPLPTDLKYRAKPFIDVTVDRLAKGAGALLILVLIKDWGLGLTWQQLSIASLSVMALWIVFALRARREYLASFRRSIEQQDMRAADIRIDTADLSTIETLVSELAHPEPRRVLYAIDLLESLDKRHLVTPLLLFHESSAVRARALRVAEAAGEAGAERWTTAVERALKDADSEVRLAAMRAVGAIRHEGAAVTLRPYLKASDPKLVVTAATALASTGEEPDLLAAEEALRRLADDTREQEATVRLEVAQALGHVQNPRFRPMLIPLMYDADLNVARAAILSAGKMGSSDYLFVPPLVSLLRNRLLKASARQVLVGYGEGVIDALAYFLRDRDEDPWVRRHVPSTLALIPSQASMNALVSALSDADGFVRFKAIAAIERLRQDHPELTVDAAVVAHQIARETTRAFSALTLHHNLFVAGPGPDVPSLDRTSLLARALDEKHERTVDRVFRLLALVNPPADIRVVRMALSTGDARARSSATEYLDNMLSGDVRRRVMLLVEDMPAEERIRKGNVLHKTRVRDVDDSIAQLVHDDDQVIAAAAIHLVEERAMWALADDLEHVLAHRDVRDWYVFEAASWALAAYRMPAERRRALWLEPLPAVELADRLRGIQLFDFASVDELFRIAGLGRQVRHESGRVLYEQGHAPERLQFLLDGRVVARADRGETEEIAAPATLAFEEELEGSPMRATIRAVEPAICLSLTTEEFLSLLSENVEIAQGIFRLLIETKGRPEWRTVMHGRLAPEIQSRVEGGLDALDRVLLLQSSPLLARATAPQLLRLASIARAIPLEKGADPFGGGSQAALLIVLSGGVKVELPGSESDLAEAGDALGIYETLGGSPLVAKAEVTVQGSALRFARADLFDLLADNIDLLQGIFSGLLRARPAPAAEGTKSR